MSRPSPADRILRRLSLLAYLSGQGEVSFGELARHFDVPLGVVVEDVFALWTLNGRPDDDTADFVDFSTNLPEEVEPGNLGDEEVVAASRLSLLEGQNLDRPVPLSTRERMAVALGLRQLAELLSPMPREYARLRAAVASALDKLTPARVADIAEIPEVAIDPQVMRAVTRATDDERQLWLRYVSVHDEETVRTVEPAQVSWEAGQWVLHAWCRRAGAPRSFRLDRITEIRELTQPVEAQHVAGLRQATRAGAVHRAEDLTLLLDSRALWRVEEVPHHSITEHAPGQVQVHLPVANPVWFAGFLLSLGSSVLAVQPAEAAVHAAQRAQDALRLYQELEADSH